MLHFSRVEIDLPLYHRSVVRIGIPYTGPRFLWCQIAGSWTWDLQFDFIPGAGSATPDVCVGWGIHLVHPHPPERMANWLPRLGFAFGAGLPIARSVTHGNHKDYFQLRVDPAGNDQNGRPQFDIKLTFVHDQSNEEDDPDFDPEIPWWKRWFWKWFTGIIWWKHFKIHQSSVPPFEIKKDELRKLLKS